MRIIRSLLVILICVIITTLYQFVDGDFFHTQFVELGSYDRQPIVMDEARDLMQYWTDNRILIDRDVYTIAEQQHLYDIKILLRQMLIIALISIVGLIIVTLLLYRYSPPVSWLRLIGQTVIIYVCIGMLLVGGAWIARDRLFDLFHRIFFTDNRSFSAESFLIQSYPRQFFYHALWMIIIRVCMILLSLYIISYLWRKYSDRQKHRSS